MEFGFPSDSRRSDPVAAAAAIVVTRAGLHAAVRSSAEGFAALDFAQGTVAIDLPADTAWSIVSVLHGASDRNERDLLADLVDMWLAHYRRAYSCLIMRVLEDSTDSMTA